MTTGPLRSRLLPRGLVIDPVGEFTIDLGGGIAEADASLVIDIYDLESPTHPDGHVGWWKYPLDGGTSSLTGRLSAGPTGLEPSLDGIEPSARWQNPEIGSRRSYLVMSVLRSNVTNGILHMDRIPATENASDLAALRAQALRSPGLLATASFALPPNARVHIVAPDIRPRDAVGNLCLDLHLLLTQNNIPSTVYADMIDLSINDMVELKSHLGDAVGPDDQILYFYSTDDPTLPAVAELRCARKTAYFHGVTNPRLLRVFDPEGSTACERALAALPALRRFDRLAANSAANADILARAVGESRRQDIAIVPPALLSAEEIHRADAMRESALLFVGQIKPHKKVEDVLRLFAAYRLLSPDAECWIVGAARVRAYRDYLGWVESEELKLPAGSVKWLGSVGDADLSAIYERAGAYVSMSEDEGFCVPLFEAMRHGLPVFAFDVPAVREMRGGAGTGFSTKDPARLAGEVHELLADPVRKGQVVARQLERASALLASMDGSGFLRLIAPG